MKALKEWKNHQYLLNGGITWSSGIFRMWCLEIWSKRYNRIYCLRTVRKNKSYSICPGAIDTYMYRSFFGRRPKLKPEYVAEKVLGFTNPSSLKAETQVIIG